MDGELVSVIIPVYNVEKYLTACVESVINSDYNNLEIILVDDGATDSCPEMCDELAKKDQRIVVIHKENGGLSSARNAGLDLAKGKYVTFVDSDDIITADMISTMKRIAVEEDCDIVKLGMVVTSDEKVSIVSHSDYYVMDKKEALRIIPESDPSMITICGKLYTISLFNTLRFPLGILHEDEDLTPRLFQKSRKIAISKKIGYLYMQRQNESITRAAFSKKRLVIMDIYEDRINLYRKWGYDDLIFGAYQKYVWSLRYCYQKTKSSEFKSEHIEIIERFKKIELRYLHFLDSVVCVSARIGCLDIIEALIKLIYKLQRYKKRIVCRFCRG